MEEKEVQDDGDLLFYEYRRVLNDHQKVTHDFSLHVSEDVFP
jgi:hypothetical protein